MKHMSKVDLEINVPARWARLPDGAPVRFTPIQWQVLETLLLAGGGPVSRADLMHLVWGDDSGRESASYAFDRLIRQLRRKLEPDPATPVYLRSIGEGAYVFDQHTHVGVD